MKNGIKKGIIAAIMLLPQIVAAQFEYQNLSFTNRALINPSFSALNKKSSFNTSTNYVRITDSEAWKNFNMTYEYYSESNEAGFGLFLNQSFAGNINLAITELGFSFSKPIEIDKPGKLILSFNPNFSVGYKQFYVSSIDYLLDKSIEPSSLPGDENLRMINFRPKIAFLLNSGKSITGVTLILPFTKSLATSLTKTEELLAKRQPGLIFYYSFTETKLEKGLTSRPMQLIPEFVSVYQYRNFMQRLSIKKEYVNYSYGGYYFQNIKTKQFRLGGLFSYKTGNFRFNLTTGFGIPILSETLSFQSEISMALTIPYRLSSKNNPWEPVKKVL